MKIKSLVVLAVLATAIFCFGGIASAQTLTIAQLQAEIASLMAQLAQLQGQQGATQAWCHTFNNNLGVGQVDANTNGENYNLQVALSKQGFLTQDNINQDNGTGANALPASFGENTAAAVVQFQTKYGIRASGWVGPVTRTKLNYLYGCLASFSAPSATINQGSLIAMPGFPTITGTATNVSSLHIDINGYLPAKGEVNALYYGIVPVVNGNWSFTPNAITNGAFGGPQGLSVGTYTVVVGQNESSSLMTGTLTVSQTVCTPNWQCGWGPCLNGSQSQIAVDPNKCGLSSSNVNIACPMLARICSPSEASNTMGGGL